MEVFLINPGKPKIILINLETQGKGVHFDPPDIFANISTALFICMYVGH